MFWTELLPEEIVEIANDLTARAKEEEKNGKIICPPIHQIFRALHLTPPEKVKCVIIGQDPYHTPGQANGLAFAVNNGTQPSLDNIFKELVSDMGIPKPGTGDLTPWARQGVLLLNTSLTTEAHQPAGHKSWGWQTVTRAIIEAAVKQPQPIVFLLWGKHARDAAAGIQMPENKKTLMSSHPSPFSAAKGSYGIPAFLGSKPFSKTNDFLTAHGVQPINWTL